MMKIICTLCLAMIGLSVALPVLDQLEVGSASGGVSGAVSAAQAYAAVGCGVEVPHKKSCYDDFWLCVYDTWNMRVCNDAHRTCNAANAEIEALIASGVTKPCPDPLPATPPPSQGVVDPIQVVGDFKCDTTKRFISGAPYSQWSSSTPLGGEVARQLCRDHFTAAQKPHGWWFQFYSSGHFNCATFTAAVDPNSANWENTHGRPEEVCIPRMTATLAPACMFEQYDQQVVYAKHLNSADNYFNYCNAFVRGPCKTEFCQGGGNTACRDECIPRTLKPTTVAKPVKPTTVAKPTAKPVKPTTVAKPTAKPVKPTFSGSIFSGSLFSGSLFSGSLFSGSLFSGSIFHHERPTYWRSGAVETDIQADQKWTWNAAEDQDAQLLN